jgi:hypothetical protein
MHQPEQTRNICEAAAGRRRVGARGMGRTCYTAPSSRLLFCNWDFQNINLDPKTEISEVLSVLSQPFQANTRMNLKVIPHSFNLITLSFDAVQRVFKYAINT